jgi:hypothetical protein
MMRTKLSLITIVCFAASLAAQQVEPSSMIFFAVPPNTSPAEQIAFSNTGDTELELNVTISGAYFQISENRCANGVRPHSHCNVFVTYTPQIVGESDNGNLILNFGDDGEISVELGGQTVNAIDTEIEVALMKGEDSRVHVGEEFGMIAKLWVEDKFYSLPTGEQISATCTDGSETIDLGSATLALCKGKGCASGPYDYAPFYVTPDQGGKWSCTAAYDGDGILGESSGVIKFEATE